MKDLYSKSINVEGVSDSANMVLFSGIISEIGKEETRIEDMVKTVDGIRYINISEVGGIFIRMI